MTWLYIAAYVIGSVLAWFAARSWYFDKYECLTAKLLEEIIMSSSMKAQIADDANRKTVCTMEQAIEHRNRWRMLRSDTEGMSDTDAENWRNTCAAMEHMWQVKITAMQMTSKEREGAQ